MFKEVLPGPDNSESPDSGGGLSESAAACWPTGA